MPKNRYFGPFLAQKPLNLLLFDAFCHFLSLFLAEKASKFVTFWTKSAKTFCILVLTVPKAPPYGAAKAVQHSRSKLLRMGPFGFNASGGGFKIAHGPENARACPKCPQNQPGTCKMSPQIARPSSQNELARARAGFIFLKLIF